MVGQDLISIGLHRAKNVSAEIEAWRKSVTLP